MPSCIFSLTANNSEEQVAAVRESVLALATIPRDVCADILPTLPPLKSPIPYDPAHPVLLPGDRLHEEKHTCKFSQMRWNCALPERSPHPGQLLQIATEQRIADARRLMEERRGRKWHMAPKPATPVRSLRPRRTLIQTGQLVRDGSPKPSVLERAIMVGDGKVVRGVDPLVGSLFSSDTKLDPLSRKKGLYEAQLRQS
uniref:Uncharacterized protein n=1 Tax=Noctiluca scintillans TaxID=2966 RepID=A0A7S1AG62_NOCSC|mmetsp:Transcript_45009/g.119313  ORF Transcript_45009/g.119313 Transcript_45009/m.119313 type:complete len:199 (+) Transcript_45009:131-727(+)